MDLFAGIIRASKVVTRRPKTPAKLAFESHSRSIAVTEPIDFNNLTQTTNLGVRSSNLFGRAITLLIAVQDLYGR